MKQWKKPVLNSLNSASTETCTNFMGGVTFTGTFICKCGRVWWNLQGADEASITCCTNPELSCYQGS